MSFCAVLCLPALEAERVFAVLSFLMAVSTGALCLVFALCWTSQTVRSYSNTRSLLMAGQALYPTTLLLLTMASTGNATATLKICKKKNKKNPTSFARVFTFHFINYLSCWRFRSIIFISSKAVARRISN